MLTDINLTCPAEECKKKMRYEEMMEHIKKECEFVELTCPGCDTKCKRGELGAHVATC